MFSGTFSVKPCKDGSYFIDRDGRNFYFILNYLRDDDIVITIHNEILIDELLKEAQAYELTNLVAKLKNLKSDEKERELTLAFSPFAAQARTIESEIIDTTEKALLASWIPLQYSNKKFKLLFSTKQDGYTSKSFHDKCNNKSPTVTIVHSNYNHVFGGFTPIAWDSSGSYKPDNSKLSFIFLLRSQKGDIPNKFTLKASNISYAIYCDPSYGPMFGNGQDFYIINSCNSSSSSCSGFGTAYEHSSDGNKLAGSSSFTVKDYEVFILE